MVMNHVGNSIEALSKKSGELLQNPERGVIKVRFELEQQKGPMLKVRITDRGPGMPPKKHAHFLKQFEEIANQEDTSKVFELLNLKKQSESERVGTGILTNALLLKEYHDDSGSRSGHIELINRPDPGPKQGLEVVLSVPVKLASRMEHALLE